MQTISQPWMGLQVDQRAPGSYIFQTFKEHQALYQSQPVQIQRFIDAQARLLAEALDQKLDQVQFALPDQVVSEQQLLTIPPDQQERQAGKLINRLARVNLRRALVQCFTELEHSPEESVSIASRLVRHATAMDLVYRLLPSGRNVQYGTADGEEIPSVPNSSLNLNSRIKKSAILAQADAVVEESEPEESRGELQLPYPPAALFFYLPQWIAFDEQGNLILNSAKEAEAHLESMQHFMQALHDAVSLAPYIVADPTYQQKRYGMLGQLINQGRALALFYARQIIIEIQRRVSAHDLNRGLSLSLPYFDDQGLHMELHEIGVIPSGRIMFLHQFVVRAMQDEEAKVAQDTRLSPSTRKHLLAELRTIAHAFAD